MHRDIKSTLILGAALTLATPLPAQIGPPAAEPSSPAQIRQPAAEPFSLPIFQVNPFLGNSGGVQRTGDTGTGGVMFGGYPGVPNYLGGGRLLNSQASSPSSGLSGQTSPFGSPSMGSPYGVGSPYSPYPIYDPVGSTLQGIASLTTAHGQYGKDYQNARLLNQDVERSRIETRMHLYQESNYRRSLQPTAESLRRATLDLDLARARKQAPVGEILSGKSSNDLLAFLMGEAARGKRGLAAPLDEAILKDLNVTTEFGGNIGLIKSGNVNWPPVLMDPAFSAAREKIDTTLKDAVERARINGKVDEVLLRDLETAHRRIDYTLDRVGAQLTIAEYMEAKRHLALLGEGRRALSDPNVANYFNRRYEARGKTVAELIDYMRREGLRFAPAVAGGERAYRSLYSNLGSYVEAMQSAKP